MKTKSLILPLLLSTFAPAAFAADLPHAELVAKFVKTQQSPSSLPGCTGPRMTAPKAAGPEANCWAASTAADLSKLPTAVRSLVLDPAVRGSTLGRCRGLSLKERFASEECAAAGRADSFIAIRLPSIRSSLEPAQWNKARSTELGATQAGR
jgi:hypothetical protein